jgi:hypothetical protein
LAGDETHGLSLGTLRPSLENGRGKPLSNGEKARFGLSSAPILV